jgi:hypothetical protein
MVKLRVTDFAVRVTVDVTVMRHRLKVFGHIAAAFRQSDRYSLTASVAD